MFIQFLLTYFMGISAQPAVRNILGLMGVEVKKYS